MQLSNVLKPVLAFNGGATQTHALVPGSPAIDAGDAVCTDANGNPLLTDQRGKPRTIDGNGDGTARCDIGAFEFFPVVNNLVTLDSNSTRALIRARARRSCGQLHYKRNVHQHECHATALSVFYRDRALRRQFATQRCGRTQVLAPQ